MLTGVCVLIPAAGRGDRFGSVGSDGLPQNKLFAPLLGRPILGWTLEAFAKADIVDSVVLIGNPNDLPRLQEIGATYGGGKVHEVVQGGADRQASVRAGLQSDSVGRSEVVAVHDGARPCITPDLIHRVITAVQSPKAYRVLAATLAIPVADTLSASVEPFYAGQGICLSTGPKRDNLFFVQTPQVFVRELLVQAHTDAAANGQSATDDTALVRLVHPNEPIVQMVFGSSENIKITRPEDLDFAEAILARRQSRDMIADMNIATLRVGHGYDIHRFVEGRRLFLGGVEFPDAPRGLLGHSDADVLLHALCDALLGAAGMGDIGKLFPPSDPAHKDRPSVEFLRVVKAHLDMAGYRVGNVDVTVLAETPKIGSRVEAMKQVIADTLAIETDQVGIKATTNEGLGAIGRGEGIAAHATVLLFR